MEGTCIFLLGSILRVFLPLGLLVGIIPDRDTVHTMPVGSRVGCIRFARVRSVLTYLEMGRRTAQRLTESFVAENVTLVTAAFAADNLGPLHAPRPVGDLGNGARDGIEKGRPCFATRSALPFYEILPRDQGRDGQPHPDLNSAETRQPGSTLFKSCEVARAACRTFRFRARFETCGRESTSCGGNGSTTHSCRRCRAEFRIPHIRRHPARRVR